jgi:hypothetical protein
MEHRLVFGRITSTAFRPFREYFSTGF